MTRPIFGASQFRAEREADWKRLEKLLDLVERKSPRKLTGEDLVELPRLYSATLSALSIARETSLDHSMILYLERLSTRAYYVLYGCREPLLKQFGQFFAHGWPAAARGLLAELLIITALFIASAVAAYFLVLSEPSWYYSIVSPEMAQGRDMDTSVSDLRASIYNAHNVDGLDVFAASLFTHNSQVSILAFALGFAFGIPTLFVISANGMLLGAMMAAFASKGLGFGFTGWLMIHGSTELFAILLAGAAGLHIGRSIAFPGALDRMAAAKQAGQRGAIVMIGVIVMLLVAGLLEGFARQLITDDIARYTIALVMFTLWVSYFTFGGRRFTRGQRPAILKKVRA